MPLFLLMDFPRAMGHVCLHLCISGHFWLNDRHSELYTQLGAWVYCILLNGLPFVPACCYATGARFHSSELAFQLCHLPEQPFVRGECSPASGVWSFGGLYRSGSTLWHLSTLAGGNTNCCVSPESYLGPAAFRCSFCSQPTG